MRRTAALLSLALVAGLTLAPAIGADAAPKPREYQNCTALHKVYPHGVGRKGAHDRSSSPVRNFTVSTAVYNLNKKSDRDKDGVACEAK